MVFLIAAVIVCLTHALLKCVIQLTQMNKEKNLC
jgi:hypothetical protein